MTSIILVNYNGAKFCEECFDSLNLVEDEFNVILVDNASKDEDRKLLNEILKSKSKYKFELDFIQLEKNLGFAGGNNVGIKLALEKYKSEYIMLLNNDTIVEPNLLSELKKYLSGDIEMTTPLIVFEKEPNKIWSAGGYFNDKLGIGANGDIMKEVSSCKKEIKKIKFAPFCCVMFNSSVFERIGLLTEDYFMYFEDADFCKKMEKENMQMLFVPFTTVYHKVSASTGGFRSNFYLEWMARSQIKFIKRFYSSKLVMFRFRFKTFLKKIYFLLHLNFGAVKAINKGLKG